jgi:putative inorganic carbon (hco3(-)) transporter
MFQYAPFQRSYEKTFISTNGADRGNAHSEYIGPLAESGIPGTLTFLAILIATVYTALNIYYRSENKEIRMLSLCLLLGLITYFIHGLLNNFLDTDKASVPFWGFIAMIVALDVYHEPAKKKKEISRI